ncbi:hypothetical protein E2986_09122 [Frieseomelitta varia]|uniref:Uncharacterized protein n=1 Tax=Frieseomelitta varia TaxID=561572 RepID=A0A833W440_9HYME|nr:hypothetical protein E2986_09122 [Frieseomelitta varia]
MVVLVLIKSCDKDIYQAIESRVGYDYNEIKVRKKHKVRSREIPAVEKIFVCDGDHCDEETY